LNPKLGGGKDRRNSEVKISGNKNGRVSFTWRTKGGKMEAQSGKEPLQKNLLVPEKKGDGYTTYSSF